MLFRSQAGGDEVLELSRLIKGRDPAVAGAGQRAGALHNFTQNGIDIEALADAQTGLAQPGEALSQRLDLYSQLAAWFQFSHPGRTAVLTHRLDAATGFETGTGPTGADLTVLWQ